MVVADGHPLRGPGRGRGSRRLAQDPGALSALVPYEHHELARSLISEQPYGPWTDGPLSAPAQAFWFHRGFDLLAEALGRRLGGPRVVVFDAQINQAMCAHVLAGEGDGSACWDARGRWTLDHVRENAAGAFTDAHPVGEREWEERWLGEERFFPWLERTAQLERSAERCAVLLLGGRVLAEGGNVEADLGACA